jgi:aryl-alcohol dehydrogenase-like predicted oxidoreductase
VTAAAAGSCTTRRLGSDGPEITTVGVGAWGIGGAFGPVPAAHGNRLVKAI